MIFEQYLIFTISTVLIFIWMETDAIVEYSLKLKIPLPLIKEFWEFKKQMPIYYPDYLAFNKNCFLTRLLSCNYCLNVILNLIFYISLCNHFNLIVLSTNILLGWASYAALLKIMKQNDK